MASRSFSKIAVAAFTALFFTAVSAAAQTNAFHGGTVAPRGVPASVTSFGFGGHPGFHGVPASVTSQNFGARIPFRGTPGFGLGVNHGIHQRTFRVDHRRRGYFYSPFYGGYYVPYAYPYWPDYDAYDNPNDEPQPPAEDTQMTRGYDDRQLLNNDYRAELNSPREQQSESAPEPVAAQPSTVLVYKDGHEAQVENYAIVGTTLYDLSDGRSKKVQLADLDLAATVKENDDRGVEFQLPASVKLN